VESEAKLFIQREILLGRFELVWSYILDYENSVNPYSDRKTSIAGWCSVAVMDVSVSPEIVECANRIMVKGIKKKDALHLACAITAKCQYFLTTDKKLLNKRFEEITIMNPLDFIRKLEI
jgi:predicted nucleic acid-binding protein